LRIPAVASIGEIEDKDDFVQNSIGSDSLIDDLENFEKME